MAVDRADLLTHFSFPAPSSQDPALPLKEIPEDKLGQGLLEGRSEVSGCLFFFEHFVVYVEGWHLPSAAQNLQSSKDRPPTPTWGLLSSPQEALRVGTGPGDAGVCPQHECMFQPDSVQPCVCCRGLCCVPSTVLGALMSGSSATQASR